MKYKKERSNASSHESSSNMSYSYNGELQGKIIHKATYGTYGSYIQSTG